MDLNELALEISKSLFDGKHEEIEKALPPRIAYRLKRWFQQMSPKLKALSPRKKQLMQRGIAQKMEEYLAVKDLKKNEMMTSVYKNKDVKMFFGSEIPENIKKMAIDWAKKRGLKPIEVSLNKSQNKDAPEQMLFSSINDTFDETVNPCIKRVIKAF